jgi:hypothetical protein
MGDRNYDAEEDQELETTSEPDRAWNALEDEIEIVDEEDQEPSTDSEEDDGPSVEELQAKLASYESSSNNTNEQLASSLGELGTVLKELKAQPGNTQQQEQQVQESIDQIRQRLSDKYYDAPLETVDEYVKAMLQKELGPYLNQMSQQLTETRRGFTKAKVEQDETGKLVLENYGDEVEKLVTQQNMDYENAVKYVSANHLSEIIDLKVQSALESVGKDDDAGETKARNKNPSRNPGQRPPSGPKKVVIPRKVRQQLENEATQRGIEPKHYISWVKKNQPERLKGGK